MVNEQIVNDFMAIVKWNSAIDYVKGALSKPVKKEGHSHGDYLIGTHREAPSTNPHCSRAYVKGADAYERTTPITPSEVQVRTKFTAVSRAVAARKQDVSKIASDQAAFNAQKDQPGGKKTMTAYLWKVCGDAYDEQQG